MSNEAIETIINGSFKLEIFYDNSSESPMEWGWPVDRLDTRSNLESMDKRELIENYGNIWFSQVPTQSRGYTYIVAKKCDWIRAMKDGGTKAVYHGWDTTKLGMQNMVDNMANIMHQYLEGDIYGYGVSIKTSAEFDCEKWEEQDSCWGYYGMKDVLQQGESVMAECTKKEQEAKDFEKQAMAI